MEEVVIIGGGPAGLIIGRQLAEKNKQVLIIEKNEPGGLLMSLYPEKIIENYPGIEKIKACELAQKLTDEAKSAGVKFSKSKVLNITKDKKIITNDEANKEIEAKIIIIATGSAPRGLGLPGEDKFNWGDKGIYYYATNPIWFRNRKVLVVGGGDSALDAALDAAQEARKVILIHRRDEFRGSQELAERCKNTDNIQIMLSTKPKAFDGRLYLEKAILDERGEEKELKIDKAILAVGIKPQTEMFDELGLEKDDSGFLKIDANLKTNVEDIYAIGDVCSGLERVVYEFLRVAPAGVEDILLKLK